MTSKISIIMGSISDKEVMNDAVQVCEQFNIPFEMKVVSAHRTPEMMQDYAIEAKKRGIKVIIAGAGGAAHLPGMVAALTVLPVIGVPIKLKSLDGLDSLLSIVQMPKGVPVASVAINNAYNAALLAVQVLAIDNEKLSQKLSDYKKSLKDKVHKMNQEI